MKKNLFKRSAEVAAVAVAIGTYAGATWSFLHAELLSDSGSRAPWATIGALSLVAAPIAWILADLLSGLVHFFADNFGRCTTPVVGPLIIAPFREHHEFPEAILQHGFLERSAGNAVASIPLLLWIPKVKLNAPLPVFCAALCLQLAIWVVLTNEIHAHCHRGKKSGLLRWLQRHGVILAPEQHDRHHNAAMAVSQHGEELPTESALHYCVSSGICDRIARWALLLARKVKLSRQNAAQ